MFVLSWIRARVLFALTFSMFAMFAVAAGCSKSDADPQVQNNECTRVGSLIDTKRSCRADGECPCGAHCELGRCIASCRESSDCPGGYCDQFGRCRAGEDRNLVAIIQTTSRSATTIAVAPTTINALTSDPRSIRVEVAGGGSSSVRIAVEAPVQVACAPNGSFASECTFERVQPGTPVYAQVKTDLPLVVASIVRVYSASIMRTITIAASGATQNVASAPVPSFNATAALGRYTGIARLIGAGIATASDRLTDQDGEVQVALSAELAGAIGNATLVLRDPSKLLLHRGEWVAGYALEPSGAGTLRFPAQRFSPAAFGVGAEVEVLEEVIDTAASYASDRLTFDLVLRQTGALVGARGLTQAWRVVLIRQGPLPSSYVPPAIGPAEVRQLDPARASLRTPWEQLLPRTFEPLPQPGTVAPAVALALGESIQRTYEGTEAWLDSCGRTPADVANFASHFIAADFLETGPARTVAPFTATSSTLRGVVTTVTGVRTLEDVEASADYPMQVLGRALGTTFSKVELSQWTSGVRDAIFSPGLVPCAFDDTAPSPGVALARLTSPRAGTAVNTSAVKTFTVDRCVALSRKYRCSVEPADANVDFLITAAGSAEGGVVFRTDGLLFRAHANKACRLPLMPPSCDAAAACYEPPASSAQPRSTMRSSPYVPSLRAQSGELSCGEGARSAAYDLVENGELTDGSPEKLSAADAGEACRADLARFFDTATNTIDTTRRNGEGVRAIFRPARCFDGPRWLTALGMLTSSVGDNPLLSEEAGRKFLHSIAQWLEVHLFLARETLHNERLGPILRKNPVTGRPPPLPLERELSNALRVWSIFFHPRFATTLARLPGNVIYAPDYRADVVTGTLPSPQGQADSPSVKMLDLLALQLQLGELGVDRAALENDPTRLTVVEQVLAFVPMVLSTVRDLETRAKAHQDASGVGEPAWGIREARAKNRVERLLASVLTKAEGVRAGKNPLGIEDADTPLYFLAANNLGPGKRFSAVSDYLLGEPGPASTGWATALTRQAGSGIDDAREAWAQQVSRELQNKLTNQQQADRALDSAASYGDPILSMCGPIAGLDKYSLIEAEANRPGRINPDTCWIRTEQAECRANAKTYAKQITADDIGYQICVMSELQRVMGGNVPAANLRFLSAEYNRRVREGGCTDQSVFVPEGCPETKGEPCYRCATASGKPAQVVLAVLPESLAVDIRGVPDAQKVAASAVCLGRFKKAIPRLPNVDAVGGGIDSRTCLKGSLGELALTVSAAAKEAEAATSEMQDLTDSYDIAMAGCNISAKANNEVVRSSGEFIEQQKRYRAAKLAMDIVASVASGVKDCASAIAGSKTDFGVTAGVGCVASGVQAGAESASSGLQFAMDDALESHEQYVESIQLAAENERCFNDAKLLLVGAKTTGLRAAAASLDVDSAFVQLRNQKAELRRLLADGLNDAEYIKQTTVAPVAYDFWFDERVTSFTRNMTLAKRASYLAAKAVEYELQSSLKVRADILAAEVPSELEASLDILRAVSGARRIKGSAPSDLKIVLSLREQLLQIADRSQAPAGEQRLTDVERFRLYLADARFRVQDPQGRYLGQRIPFSIAPLGALAAGNPGAITVFSKNDCAERLWSVNAALQGSGLFRGSESTFARVDLLKSNTFYSQWCSPPDKGPEFQVARVRPTRNLFLDPTLGTEVGQGFGLANEESQFARARISAALNVDRARFGDDSFANGETSELAARGLYGDYALFFPAEVLSVVPLAADGRPGAATPGLDLTKIDDILLRLDYVSVAR
jgi:hypothetical protein